MGKMYNTNFLEVIVQDFRLKNNLRNAENSEIEKKLQIIRIHN